MTLIWYCSGLETAWLSIGRSFIVKAISIFNIFLWHHFRTIKKFGCALCIYWAFPSCFVFKSCAYGCQFVENLIYWISILNIFTSRSWQSHLTNFVILFCIQVMCSHDPIKGAGPPLWSPVYRELGACDPVSLFGLVATSQRPLVPRLGSRLKGAAAHGTHGGGTHWWGGRRQRWSNLVSGAFLQQKNSDLRF